MCRLLHRLKYGPLHGLLCQLVHRLVRSLLYGPLHWQPCTDRCTDCCTDWCADWCADCCTHRCIDCYAVSAPNVALASLHLLSDRTLHRPLHCFVGGQASLSVCEDGSIDIDFAGSSGQSPFGINCVLSYVVMAYVVMAYIVVAYPVMDSFFGIDCVLSYVVMAYIVMAYIVVAYSVMDSCPSA